MSGKESEQKDPYQVETEVELAEDPSRQVKSEIVEASVNYNDEKQRELMIREGEPMAITNMFVDKPCTVLIIGFVTLIACSVLSFSLGFFKQAPQSNRELLVWDDERVKAWDMQEAAKDAILGARGSTQQPVRIQNTYLWNPVVLINGPTGTENLLKKEHLLKIKEIEDKLKAENDWPNFCKAKSSTDKSCSDSAFMSPLSYLYLKDKNWMSKSQTTLDSYWKQFYNNKATFNKWRMLYNSDAKIKKTGEVQFMRMFIKFGAPLDVDGTRYNDITDKYRDQRVKVSKFQEKWLKTIEDFEKENENGVKILIFSEEVAQIEFLKLIARDTSFSGLSILFVIIYFVFHLRSCFLSFIGIMLILLSFGFTALFHQGVFRVTFYSTLHNLTIFIVLGIAADDIFVFIDAWRQSAFIELYKGDKKKRMSYAWKRALRACAVTSSTTCVAFLANTLSPLMPIQSFGIYAAILIPANYFIIVMLFPAAVIYQEEKFGHLGCCCFGGGRSKEDQQEVPNTDRSDQPREQNVEIQEESVVVTFFAGTWNTMIFKMRYVIIVVFGLWLITASVFAFQIGPLTKEQWFLPVDHPLYQAVIKLRDNFDGGGNQDMKIDIYWGVKDLNLEDTDPWDAEKIGKAIMDEKFDISPVAAQTSILDFCKKLRLQKFVKQKNVDCWLEKFDAYVRSTSRNTRRLPLQPADFKKRLKEFRKTPQGIQMESDFTIGFINDTLVFMQIFSESTGDRRAAYADKHPVYMKWQNYINEYTKTAPESLKSGTQTAGIFWCWMMSERAFLSSAVYGMTCSLVFAFLILLMATRNIVLSLLAILCVSVVVISTVGVMVLKGWELGVTESIAIVIMIGLSVDYVVHLAADYTHSELQSRSQKIQQAYKEMGVSILSGFITTLGCGCALFGATLTIFQKFAIVITCTIGISFLSAMILFGALCHVVGPEGNYGNICFCMSKKEEEKKEEDKGQTNQIQ